MTEFSLPCVSVASSGGEYYEVSFAEGEDTDDDSDHDYFLVQRQFESDDGGLYYVECHDRTLCGHFNITGAELGRDMFRIRLACEPAETVQIRFRADRARYNELRRVLQIMIPAEVLKIE